MLLSVIIPTFNRAKLLSDLLGSFTILEPVLFDWEVIVIDNASTDKIAEIVYQKAKILPIRLRYVFESRQGLVYARHRGLYEAKGKYIAYLDDDMVLTSTWIRGIELLVQGKADAVVGRILPKWEVEPPKWLLAMCKNGINSYLGLLDLGSNGKLVDPLMVFGGNCFISKRIVFELGGFHPDSVPDDLLRYRGDGETGLMLKFKKNGLRSYYNPQATVFHIIDSNRMTIEYMCKRAYNQGISDSFSQVRKVYKSFSISLFNNYTIRSRYGILKCILLIFKMIISVKWLKIILAKFNKRYYLYKKIMVFKAYLSGWFFHQNELENDHCLLKYVLKDTFLEY